MSLNDPRVPTRLWAKIAVNEQTGCWLWRGAVSRGYGYSQVAGLSTRLAHRIVWLLLGNPDPGSLDLDHLCHTRACCNPPHLEPVTRSINCLRGDGPALVVARARKQSHCKHGHEYTAETTAYNGDGSRYCKLCKVAATRRFLERTPNYARDWARRKKQST